MGRVLVTGGTGYIAGQVVKSALEAGYGVRATVRDPKNETKCGYLDGLKASGADIEIVKADLADPQEIWDSVVDGCTYVIHTASPVLLGNVREEEVITPAVDGTKKVLRACLRGQVAHTVVTSSVAAIGYTGEPERTEDYTEADWSTEVGMRSIPYVKSKTYAERTAWEMVEAEEKEGRTFKLTTICPAVVIGPAADKSVSASVDRVTTICRGLLVPDEWTSIVDVRDVAEMHVRALSAPASVGQRYLSSAAKVHYEEIARAVRDEFGKYGFDIKSSAMNTPRTTAYDASKAVRDLGVQYRSVATSVVDTMYSMLELGIVEPTEQYKQHQQQQS